MIKAVFYFEDDTVTVHREASKEVETKFKSGYYSARIGNDRYMIELIKFNEIHEPFKSQKSYVVMDTIQKFLLQKNRKTCNELGYLYKLNILIYGSQGVGKSALINYIANSLANNHEAIVFRVDDPSSLKDTWTLAEEIRKIQDNLIVFIGDEFDLYCGKNNEPYMKNILDGNRSIDNSIFLAATNHMDRIPKAFSERPSRFRLVYEMKPINNKETIRGIIENIHNKASTPFLSTEDINKMIEDMPSSTIDGVKTAISDKLMNLSLDMPQKSSVGFNKNRDDDDYIDDEKWAVMDVGTGTSLLSQSQNFNLYSKRKQQQPAPTPFNHESSEIDELYR